MTKTEFLDYLEKRLHVLKEKERDDILSEYAQHIELKMQSGLSEEDAIHDFGNPDELAAEILDAYNVNPDYDKRQFPIAKSSIKEGFAKAGAKAGSLWRGCAFRVGGLFHGVAEGRMQKILRYILILAGLAVIYVPLLLLDLEISNRMYCMFGFPFDRLFSVAAVVVFHLAYVLFAVWTFYRFALKDKRAKDRTDVLEHTPETDDTRAMGKDLWSKTKGMLSSAAQKIKHLLTLPGFQKKERPAKTKGAGYYMKMLLWFVKNAFIFLLKLMAVCFLAPVLLCMLALIAVFGALLVLAALGYPVIGLAILSLGVLSSGFAFLWLASSVLFPKKVREEA